MLVTAITTYAVLLTILSTTFHQSADKALFNETTLAVVKFASIPDENTTNKKNTGYEHINTVKKIPSKQIKRAPKHRSHSIKISGYQGQTFVYGEVVKLDNDKFKGFIHHPNKSKTYVYGEKVNNKINLYDASGNFYLMVSH